MSHLLNLLSNPAERARDRHEDLLDRFAKLERAVSTHTDELDALHTRAARPIRPAPKPRAKGRRRFRISFKSWRSTFVMVFDRE